MAMESPIPGSRVCFFNASRTKVKTQCDNDRGQQPPSADKLMGGRHRNSNTLFLCNDDFGDGSIIVNIDQNLFQFSFFLRNNDLNG